MAAQFNFTLADLMSNDTSKNTGKNPFLREYLKTSPTNTAPTSSAAFLAQQGQSYDAYTSTSMLSLSDVMMGAPLQNQATGVLQTQQTLESQIVQSQSAKTISGLSIFKALVPTDLSQATGASSVPDPSTTSAMSGSTNATLTSANGTGNITPSNGIPTTSYAPGGLPQGDQPNGLPPGFVMYPFTGVPVLEFLNLALSKVGDNYIFGAVGPTVFDCSGLIMWCLQQLGPQFNSWPHFSGSQYQVIKNAGLSCSLQEAYNTAGALLFVAAGSDPAGEHVAISLGNNNGTIEAMNPQLGVRKGNVNEGTPWDVAGLIPGLDYSAVSYGNGISTMPNGPNSNTTQKVLTA